MQKVRFEKGVASGILLCVTFVSVRCPYPLPSMRTLVTSWGSKNSDQADLKSESA